MLNAHLRFGSLTYYRRTEKTTTHFQLHLDRFIGEVAPDPPRGAKAHLFSVVGGETQISAIVAAIKMEEAFTVEAPHVTPIRAQLGRNAQCYRGSIQLTDRKRAARHLIGVSEEFATESGTPRELYSPIPNRVLFGPLSPTSTDCRESLNGPIGFIANSFAATDSSHCSGLAAGQYWLRETASNFSGGSARESALAIFRFRNKPDPFTGPALITLTAGQGQNSLGAKSFRSRRQVCHSWSVPGDS